MTVARVTPAFQAMFDQAVYRGRLVGSLGGYVGGEGEPEQMVGAALAATPVGAAIDELITVAVRLAHRPTDDMEDGLLALSRAAGDYERATREPER